MQKKIVKSRLSKMMLSVMRFVHFSLVICIVTLAAGSEASGQKLIDSQLIGENTPVWLVTAAGGVMLTDKNTIRRAVTHYKGEQKKKPMKREIKSQLPDDKFEILRDEIFQYKNITFRKNLIRSKRSDSTDDIVYPELLIMADFKSKFTSLRSRKFLNFLIYLIKFWNSVNLRFTTLVNPAVQLRITGIVINIVPCKQTKSSSFSEKSLALRALNLQNLTPSFVCNEPIGKLPDNFEALVQIAEIPFIDDNIDDDSRHILPRALEDMATWIEEINFIEDKEYDIAIAMTKLPFCTYDARRRKCGPVSRISGRTHFKMNCSHKGQAVAMFNDYYDFSGIHTAAKIVAKLMGAPYDYQTGYEHCFDENRYIMSWRRDYGIKNFEWSACSQSAIQNYFRSKISKCFRNSKPYRDQGNPIEEFLPGDKISIVAQCDDYGYGAACAGKNVCKNLECRMRAWFCEYAGIPALDGSSCNNGGVCRNGLCEVYLK